MKKAFEKYAKAMESDWSQAFIRRVMWIDMEERIEKVFAEIEHSELASRYGTLYLHEGLHFNAKKFYVTQRLNQLQVSCGMRLLGLNGVDVDGNQPKKKISMEKNAALWFTQSASGGVTVFMAPYKSEVVSMNEENIIIGHYKDPSRLSEKKIKKLFSTFFHYLSITSAIHPQSPVDYIWRLWLTFLDVRTRKLDKIFGGANGLMIFGAALVTVLAYLIKSSQP